jgi:hypothetical protein
MSPTQNSASSEGSDASDTKFTELGYLFRKALHSAARGRHLTKTERGELSQYLNGEEWFSGRPSRFSDEAKIARAQTMLFGRDLRRALQRLANDGPFSKEDRKELKQWLYGVRQARVRYMLKKGLYTILYSGLLILTMLFFVPKLRSLNGNPLWVPFILSGVILLAALVKDIFFERNVDITLRQIKWSAEKAIADLEDIMEEGLEPKISVLDGREKVRRAASTMFADVLDDKTEDRLVIFTGAASLGTLKEEEPRDLDDEKLTSLEEYNAKLLQLQNAGVPIRRYVALITTSEGRKPATLQRYLGWLDNQLKLLADNPRYILIDCYRAQPWGGSRSSILTRKAFLDIVGDGESGFLVKGDRIAEILYQSTINLLASSNQTPYRGDEKANPALVRIKEELSNGLHAPKVS